MKKNLGEGAQIWAKGAKIRPQTRFFAIFSSLVYQFSLKWWGWWWWWIVFVVWLTDERRLGLFPAGTIVTDPHHCESPTISFRLSWIKFCSSDNHYTINILNIELCQIPILLSYLVVRKRVSKKMLWLIHDRQLYLRQTDRQTTLFAPETVWFHVPHCLKEIRWSIVLLKWNFYNVTFTISSEFEKPFLKL